MEKKANAKDINKGSWSKEEDQILFDYVTSHGEGKWQKLAQNAGLKRCGKSCRQRWLNYLKPGIKRGDIAPDEEDMIIRLHRLLGNRWALIAKRIPGRTDNEIKNYWNTSLSKKLQTKRQPTSFTTLSPSSSSENLRETKQLINVVTPEASRPTRVNEAVRTYSYSNTKSSPTSPNHINNGPINDRGNSPISNFLINDDGDNAQNQILMPENFESHGHEEEQNRVLSENLVDPLDTILDMELKSVAYFLGLEDECI